MTSDGKASAANVIVFGSTGAGKSSVINMLSGGEHAPTSSSAAGVTFQNEQYTKVIRGRQFNVFDTAGLNERDGGTVSAAKAIEGLYRLMRALRGGINLLVYVMQGPRLHNFIGKNYEMFYEIFCEKQVPIVLAITHLENEDNIDGWWMMNKKTFMDQGMKFKGVACVTAIKGKRNVYAEEFEESKGKIEELIWIQCSEKPWSPPAGPAASWLVAVLVKVCNSFSTFLPFKPIVIAKSVYQALKLEVLWGHG